MSTATQERDSAIDQVSRPSWMDVAMSYFANLELPEEFTGEDIRLALDGTDCPAPHHHNAWGAFTMILVRNKFIMATGGFAQMKAKKSHARITRVYQKVT